jgi:hypothetical protein
MEETENAALCLSESTEHPEKERGSLEDQKPLIEEQLLLADVLTMPGPLNGVNVPTFHLTFVSDYKQSDTCAVSGKAQSECCRWYSHVFKLLFHAMCSVSLSKTSQKWSVRSVSNGASGRMCAVVSLECVLPGAFVIFIISEVPAS